MVMVRVAEDAPPGHLRSLSIPGCAAPCRGRCVALIQFVEQAEQAVENR